MWQHRLQFFVCKRAGLLLSSMLFDLIVDYPERSVGREHAVTGDSGWSAMVIIHHTNYPPTRAASLPSETCAPA